MLTTLQGFIQDFILGGKNEDACKGRMHVSVYLLDFNQILEIFKYKKRQIQL